MAHPLRWSDPLKPQVVETIVSRLKQEPAHGAEILALGTKVDISAEELPTILEILIHNGVVTPCRSDFAAVDRSASGRVNHAVFDLALAGTPIASSLRRCSDLQSAQVILSAFAALVLGDDPDINDTTAAGRMLDRLEGVGRKS